MTPRRRRLRLARCQLCGTPANRSGLCPRHERGHNPRGSNRAPAPDTPRAGR